jgi:environmental stress-induced protein Ves
LIPFAIDALRSEPWRNGAGWTRTVCAHAVDGEVLWRISVADITGAGAFSQFEGMERTAVMVQGGRLKLSNAEVQFDFDGMGAKIQFPGEWSLDCSAPATATQLLNIMVRRGRAQAQVEVVKGAAFTLNPGGAQMVLVLRGQFNLQSARGRHHTVLARHGVHWQQLDQAWRAEPVGDDARMVCCTLRGS